MRRASSCILLRGSLAILLLIVASTQYCHATRWHPAWDKNIKLFYNKLLNRELQSQHQSKSRRSITTGYVKFNTNRFQCFFISYRVISSPIQQIPATFYFRNGFDYVFIPVCVLEYNVPLTKKCRLSS